jgi:4-hydroxybenzoate polyprenyltransferase
MTSTQPPTQPSVVLGSRKARLRDVLAPYAQLIRLSRPIGVIIINFPYLYGSLFAACISQPPISRKKIFQNNVILLLGTFLLRGWACALNDIADRDLDKLVARCKQRPMARGAISVRNACIFTGLQFLAWFTLMAYSFPTFPFYGIPLTVLVVVYPYTKRVTAYTPVFLGFTFAWGSVIGCVSSGVDPVHLLQTHTYTFGAGLLLLCYYYMIWTVLFETVYAFQDLEDDTKAEINSMAVRYRHHAKLWLTGFGFTQILALYLVGKIIDASSNFHVGGPVLNATIVSWMVADVNLGVPKDCAWWFGHGPLLVGISTSVTLIWEYIARAEMF